MMPKPIYPIVRMQLPFVEFSILCYKFYYFIKTDYVSIYHRFWRDHESSGFRKLAVNKWICRKNCDYLLIFGNSCLPLEFFVSSMYLCTKTHNVQWNMKCVCPKINSVFSMYKKEKKHF